MSSYSIYRNLLKAIWKTDHLEDRLMQAFCPKLIMKTCKWEEKKVQKLYIFRMVLLKRENEIVDLIREHELHVFILVETDTLMVTTEKDYQSSK